MTTQRQLAKMSNRPNRIRTRRKHFPQNRNRCPFQAQGQGQVISRRCVVSYGDSASLIPCPRPLLLLVQVARKVDAAVLLGTRLYPLQGLRLRNTKRFS